MGGQKKPLQRFYSGRVFHFSAVHFLGKMVVLHILNVPRLIASNSRKQNCFEVSDLLGKLSFH